MGFDSSCMNGCNLSFVESLPVGLNYTDSNVLHESTYDSWVGLISLAREKIEIASMYWTLRREDVYPDESAKQVTKTDWRAKVSLQTRWKYTFGSIVLGRGHISYAFGSG